MSPHLRSADPSDLNAVVALEHRCFLEDPWTRGMLGEEIARPGGIFLVMGPPGRPLAFGIAWAVLDDLHVLQVAVDPDARRTGLGKSVVAGLEARAWLATTAWLEVRRDNVAAIGLYASAGYHPVGTRPAYYTDGCDALVLRKRLPGPAGTTG